MKTSNIPLWILFCTVIGFLVLTWGQSPTQTLPVTLSVNVPQPTKVLLLNTLITPGNDLIAIVTGPTTYTFGSFSKDSRVTLFILNDGSNQLSWASSQKMVVIGGHMPTNQIRAAIVFEEVMG